MTKTGKRREPVKIPRAAILWKTRGKCAYCGYNLSVDDFHIDHYYPLSKARDVFEWFGVIVTDASNLLPACELCNKAKSDTLPGVFKTRLEFIDVIGRKPIDEALRLRYKGFIGTFYFETLNKKAS